MSINFNTFYKNTFMGDVPNLINENFSLVQSEINKFFDSDKKSIGNNTINLVESINHKSTNSDIVNLNVTGNFKLNSKNSYSMSEVVPLSYITSLIENINNEALFSGDSFVMVYGKGTPEENALEFYQKYNDAVSRNLTCMIVAPGEYDFTNYSSIFSTVELSIYALFDRSVIFNNIPLLGVNQSKSITIRGLVLGNSISTEINDSINSTFIECQYFVTTFATGKYKRCDNFNIKYFYGSCYDCLINTLLDCSGGYCEGCTFIDNPRLLENTTFNIAMKNCTCNSTAFYTSVSGQTYVISAINTEFKDNIGTSSITISPSSSFEFCIFRGDSSFISNDSKHTCISY